MTPEDWDRLRDLQGQLSEKCSEKLAALRAPRESDAGDSSIAEATNRNYELSHLATAALVILRGEPTTPRVEALRVNITEARRISEDLRGAMKRWRETQDEVKNLILQEIDLVNRSFAFFRAPWHAPRLGPKVLRKRRPDPRRTESKGGHER